MMKTNAPLMKRALILACTLLLTLAATAAKPKEGYRFDLKIDGNRDSLMLLGYYYAQNRMVFDTAYNDGKGGFFFKGDRELKPGLYYFNNGKGRFVDFVVYHETPRFKFHTDERDWQRNMSVSGSRQNTLFFNFNRSTEHYYDAVRDARDEMDSAAFLEFRRQQFLRVDTLRLDFIARHPESMLARMMMASKDPLPPPDSVTGNDRYFYIMHHFFDNMPLDDNFIIRTPRSVFYNRIDEYVDKRMQGLPPEFIIPLLDTLIDRSEPAPEVFKWLVLTLTERYLQSNIMVYDEVYVHLVQRYFATGKVTFLPPSTVDEQVTRASKWEHLLVGREAPELILFDTTRRVWSLHHMPGRYTLLLFWSPTCGHCRTIIPEVYQVFDRVADSLDMTAFAILSEPEEHTVEKWKTFLADHHMTNPRWVNLNGGEANIDWREVYDVQTTPQIYLIDNDTHKFLAKKLSADLLELICKRL
jgi:thiol-disulfide isomerase/thioredoxin